MEEPKKMMQDANGYLRTAQNNMFSGKNAEAVELINKADELAMQAKTALPGDFQVESLLQKIEKMRKELERKGIATRPGSGEKLPFDVESQLGRIREILLKKDAEWAKREIDNYYSRFAGPMTDLPAFKELLQLYQKLETEVADAAMQQARNEKSQADARIQHEELCYTWEMKLNALPYFNGMAQDLGQLMMEKENYRKATELFNEFEQVKFEGELTFSLESLTRSLRQRLQLFRSNLSGTANLLVSEILSQIEAKITFLQNDTAWMSNADKVPNYISENEINELSARIEKLRPLFDENIMGTNNALFTLNRLIELNDRRKKERSSRVVMKPEAISGEEAEAPKNAAIQALLSKYPDATILKTAIIRNWEMNHYEGWEDTSNTRWIHRNTNEATAQIAAQLSGETCKLFTLHVEKEVLADGSSGALKSHIMFEESADKGNFK